MVLSAYFTVLHSFLMSLSFSILRRCIRTSITHGDSIIICNGYEGLIVYAIITLNGFDCSIKLICSIVTKMIKGIYSFTLMIKRIKPSVSTMIVNKMNIKFVTMH